MEIIIIAAKGWKNEIGVDNKLLWRLPNDMKFFSETTKGYPVIMGRKTYESIPKKFRPLPERTNIVISSTKDFSDEGAVMSMNFLHSLGIAESMDVDKVFIIGGETIYKRAIKFADKMILTEVHGVFPEANIFFPYIDLNVWKGNNFIREQKPDEKHEYGFGIYEYTRK